MLALTDLTHLIMVSYFRPNDLKRCVESILTNTKEPYHLSIIDNSHGGIDTTLNTFTDPHITIYRNTQNLGKGRAFMKWYAHIIKDSNSDHFISIDSDLLVPPDWLLKLQMAAYRIRGRHPLGVLAPVIMNEVGEDFQHQISNDKVVMHRTTNASSFVLPNVYRNRHTAGPLFLIDRQFFESVRGYMQTQMYGNDDGELCKAAARQERFIGIVTDVEVLHLNDDATDGYREWKKRNVNMDVDHTGFWDQTGNSNNTSQ